MVSSKFKLEHKDFNYLDMFLLEIKVKNFKCKQTLFQKLWFDMPNTDHL